ncbi:putative Nodal modulator 1 protein [Naja naja]|nr:putative Nodal modulator 1 protein [Naja naja]
MLGQWGSPAWGCWWWAVCGALWAGAGGSEDIVVGCGGFVRSDVEINYSLIEIKLYTKHGTLKYQTDCAPNNGYFMIPLYDKGDFILKIEPPLGWSFEPTSVDIHVDGINDICTKGGDINFVFTGFSVNGKVLSKGQDLGPASVFVALRSPSTGVTLQSTTTQPGGKYAFLKVLPGEYEIFASHPTWTLKEATTTVRVTSSNAYASSPLIVAGYNVSGSVRSDGEPMKGVMFLLFSSSVAKEDIMGCNPSPVDGFPARDDSLAYLCNVISKEDGTFTFQSLPRGRELRLTSPLPNWTSSWSTIVSELSQSSTSWASRSRAHKDHLFFDIMTVKIAPNTPQLADIIVTEFSVCGQISVTRFPDSIKQITKYKVNMWPQEKEKAVLLTTETDARGGFCFKARPGLYVLQVIVPDAEVRAGLALKPKVFPVTVASKPVLDVIFSQFLASVSGKITCLDACGELMVILQSILRPGEKRSLQLTAKSTSLAFTFENVLPGKYKMSIIQEDWCWKNKSLEIEVVEEDVSGIEFRQTVTPRSCHRFEHEYYTYDTSAPSILTLTAIRHHVLGTITTDKLMDVMVTIRSSIDSEPDLVLGPLKSQQELRQEQQRAEIEARRQEREKKGPDEEGSKPPVQEVVEELLGPFHYDFSYWARSGEKITVTPSSKELLFYPPSIETVVSGEGFVLSGVEDTIGDFKAFALAGVTFEIKSEDGHPLAGVLLSLSGGTFRSNLLTQDNGMLTFANLQGIAVEAVGQGECAIYGEDTVTDEEGRFRLRGLLPSCLYHIQLKAEGNDHIERALPQYSAIQVKLYKSENLDNPVHTNYMVLLDSTLSKSQYDYTLPQVSFTTIGYHKHITLVFNPTRKLPEQDIAQGSYIALPLTLLLLLAGYNHDKLIPLLLQLTSRLQGVCALGQAGLIQEASRISRGKPRNRRRDGPKKFLALDILTRVGLSRKMSSCELNVKLYKSENLDNPVHTVSLGQSLFFHFPPLLRDGENYMVLLDSTLSKSQYDYTLPQVSFTTIGYHKHITLVFNPTRKLPEQDIAQGSYIALPLTLLLLLAGYNHDKLIPLLLQLTSRLQGVCALGQAGADTGGLEDIKRQAKKQKTRRTKMSSCELNVEETECMSHPLPLNGRFN